MAWAAAALTGPVWLAHSATAVAGDEIGGDEVGIVDVGNVSVITIDPELQDPDDAVLEGAIELSAVRMALELWRGAHTNMPAPEVVVFYSNDHATLDIAGPPSYYRIPDPIDPDTFIAVVQMSGAESLGDDAMFERSYRTLIHEIGHHWVNVNVPRPVVVAASTTEGLGELGRLRDSKRALLGNVEVGDRVVFPDIAHPRALRFQVTDLGSDAGGDWIEFDAAEEYDPDPFSVAEPLLCPEPVEPPFELAPAPGTPYYVESWDFVGRQCAHWATFVDSDGSHMEGHDFVVVDGDTVLDNGRRFQFGPWDLYMMGLANQAELEPMFVVRDPVGQLGLGNTIDGVRRYFSVDQLVDALDVTPDFPRNAIVHFAAVTPLDKGVAPLAAERLDQLRRSFGAVFQDEVGDRGSLTTTFVRERPDLVAVDVTAPSVIQAGETVTVDVLLHNQSTLRAFGFGVHVDAPWASEVAVVPFGLSPHQRKTVSATFTIPDEAEVFADASYRATITVEAEVDIAGNVLEADDDHNSRATEVAWDEAISEIAPGEGHARMVTDNGTYAYVARNPNAGDWQVQELSLDDPAHPTVRSTCGDEGVFAGGHHIAASPDVLAIDLGTAVRVTPIPFDESCSGTDVPVFPFGPPAILGDVLYVPTFSGVRVVTDITTDPTIGILVPNPAGGQIQTLVVHDGRLVFGANRNLALFDLSEPSQPTLVDTFTVDSEGTQITDLVVAEDHAIVTIAEGVRAVSLTDGSVDAAFDDPSLRPDALALVGDYVVAHALRGWVVLDATSLDLVAPLPKDLLPESLAAAADVHAFRGWALLGTSDGTLAMSPTGVTHEFIRGDANGDGTVDISDPIEILTVQFTGGSYFGRQDAFDSDDNGSIEITDAIMLLNHLFLGDPPPPAPYPTVGLDPTEDDLDYVTPRE